MAKITSIRKAQGERLAAARKQAGYKSARAAAIDNNWPESSYRAHEAGTRTIGDDDAQRYAHRFRMRGVLVTAPEILFGITGFSESEQSAYESPQSKPISGLAGAGPDGSVLFSEGQGNLGEAPIIDGDLEATVLEVRGNSMRGVASDGWLIYYKDRRDPPTDDLLGELCVVGLADGRVMIKELARGRKPKHFDLESVWEPTIHDARVEWAAPVSYIVPRSTARKFRSQRRG